MLIIPCACGESDETLGVMKIKVVWEEFYVKAALPAHWQETGYKECASF